MNFEIQDYPERNRTSGMQSDGAGRDRLAVLRRSANEKRERIRSSRTLSEPQRKVALELLRQQTEEELRRALGDREFSAFRAFHGWWFRELSVLQ